LLLLPKNTELSFMNINKTTHLSLTKDEMKEYGYKIVDILAEHFDVINSKTVVGQGSRKEMDALLSEEIPNKATPAMEVLDHVTKDVLANVNLLSHPKFYSFVPSPSNFISAMSDSLATGFNIFSGSWTGSAAATKLEIITIHWLLKMFKFPVKTGGGIFTSGGSMANLTALATARNVKCGEDYSKSCIYLSDQAHSSNIKAIRVLGFKKEQVRIIPTDMEFKMSINKLKNAIAKDKLNGMKPFCILATAGTTNTGSVDPLDEIAAICKKEKLWMHVDGAYGGGAILSSDGKTRCSSSTVSFATPSGTSAARTETISSAVSSLRGSQLAPATCHCQVSTAIPTLLTPTVLASVTSASGE